MDYKERYETIITTIKAFKDTNENLKEELKKEIEENKTSYDFILGQDAHSKMIKNQNDFIKTMFDYLKDYEEQK